MQKINVIIAIIALVALCSCSGQGSNDMLAQKNMSTPTTIVDGWNANCGLYNFGFAYEEFTLGQLYKGSNFDVDMDGMEAAIAAYYGIPSNQVNGESTMGFVHFDDETVDVL